MVCGAEIQRLAGGGALQYLALADHVFGGGQIVVGKN